MKKQSSFAKIMLFIVTSFCIAPSTTSAMSISAQVNLPSAGLKAMFANSPVKRKVFTAAGLMFITAMIRLTTKSSKKDLALANLSADLKKLSSSASRNCSEFVHNFFGLIDDYIIGREFKAVDVAFEEVKEDGTIIKVKDKKIKASPFGLIGLIDAYGIKQLKGCLENSSNLILFMVALSNFIAFNDIKGALSA